MSRPKTINTIRTVGFIKPPPKKNARPTTGRKRSFRGTTSLPVRRRALLTHHDAVPPTLRSKTTFPIPMPERSFSLGTSLCRPLTGTPSLRRKGWIRFIANVKKSRHRGNDYTNIFGISSISSLLFYGRLLHRGAFMIEFKSRWRVSICVVSEVYYGS